MRNSLLHRQIQKHLGHNTMGMESFFDAIEKSYANYNDQINLLQRAMQLSSDELFEANAKLRLEAESLKTVNEDLRSILFSMNLAAEESNDNFNPAEYIKKQSEEIIKINRQREQLLKNLEKQNQELNDYAHMVSHDLKAPLRTINTLIAWIGEDSNGKLDTETQHSLGLIQYNVEKMDLLIKGILDYSSIDKRESENRVIDLNQLLGEIVLTIMLPGHIKASIMKGMPSIEGNYYRFRQLFQNIIENAIKYNDKADGLIEVGCTLENNEYVFYVKDNGRGIPKPYFEKIFNIFTKLDNKNNSSGIGLSIVKKIISFYHGRIWLESTENLGTTFYFTLPEHGTAQP